MIDVVNSVAGAGGASSYRQPEVLRAPVKVATPSPTSQPSSQGSMRIRVDNQLDMAIIEYRSSETGEVIHQYPTAAQVKALARAAELEAARSSAPIETAEDATSVPASPDTAGDVAADVQVSSGYAPPAAAVVTAAPAIASAAPVAADTGAVAAPTTSTQSITV